VWLATAIIKLQDALFEMWLARNEALHHSEEIDAIYKKKSYGRLLPHADVAFFRNKKERSKKLKMKKKENWV